MRLVLIDGYAILHRAYHAYPPLTTSQGKLVGAVYGFTSILLTVLKKLHPEYVAVAFDKKAPTFRHKKFKAYKIGRKPMDKELVGQLPYVHQVVESLNIPIFEIDGYEGDDVIGTLVRQATEINSGVARNTFLASSLRDTERRNAHKIMGPNAHIAKNDYFAPPEKESLEIIIVTGDQDALQLVDENVKVYMPARGNQPEQVFNPEAVRLKYGVKPSQIVDFKALSGDQSDGIPGVAGIGPKTAKNLLVKFGKLDKIYRRLSAVPPPIAEKLKTGRQSAFLSLDLATIDRQVPIKLAWDCCLLKDYDKEKVLKLFNELEFRSLIKKLPENGWEEEMEEVFIERKSRGEKTKTGKQMGLF